MLGKCGKLLSYARFVPASSSIRSRNYASKRNLEGRTALVTGSTSGIGLAVARTLAAEGCKIMLNGFGDANEIKQLQADLKEEFKVDVSYIGADVSKGSQVTAMIQDTIKTFGSLDILVNNAGIQHVSPVEQFPDEKWDAVIAINLSSAFHAIKAALPGMKDRKWGRIINIASVHGLVGSVNKSAYVASKFGIVGLTKVVALETAGSGVTCNTVNPGWVLTPLVEKQIHARAAQQQITYDDAVVSLLSEKQPSKQFVKAEELGGVVAFLCSNAANQVTGISLPVDGGWTAQ